jgi:hypothetical protein
MDNHAIMKIWHWEHAPEEYRKLSGHGGDEDYVILVDKVHENEYYVEAIIDRLTVCGYEKHDLGDWVLFITAHA